MYVNDPIADMLTRIRNANMVYHESVDIPISKMKLGIAKILKSEGYIRNYKVLNDPKKPFGTLKVFMNYGPNRERVVQGLRRMSKPGRRLYVGKDKLPKVDEIGDTVSVGRIHNAVESAYRLAMTI